MPAKHIYRNAEVGSRRASDIYQPVAASNGVAERNYLNGAAAYTPEIIDYWIIRAYYEAARVASTSVVSTNELGIDLYWKIASGIASVSVQYRPVEADIASANTLDARANHPCPHTYHG